MGPGYHFVILDFTVTVDDPRPEPVAGSDAGAAAWVPLADVASMPLVDGLEEFLRAHAVIA